jgi:hypothetical protein
VDIIVGFLIKRIRGDQVGTAWIVSQRVKLWSNIIEKAEPTCIIGIQPDEYLCQAGRIMNIPVYDLQHGAIIDDHRWYGEKFCIDKPVYTHPNGFLCWDDDSVSVINKWSIKKGIHARKIGNPWFLRFMKAATDDMLVQDAMNTFTFIKDRRPSILLSLQYGLKDFYPYLNCNGGMVDALQTVILETQDMYNWILRLHPIQMVGEEKEQVLHYLYTTYGPGNTEKWLTASECPLPVILSEADLHITDLSSVVIEAAWMGIRSGVLNPMLNIGGAYESMFSYERSIGIAEVLPHDPDIIKQWIADTLAKGRAESTMNTSGKELDAFINEIVERCNNHNH